VSHPRMRARRQQTRDRRRVATKTLTQDRIARGLETCSLSGAALHGQPRTVRRPAYALRAVQPPNLIAGWSGQASRRMGRAGLGAGK
jgi:hypothetical protein